MRRGFRLRRRPAVRHHSRLCRAGGLRQLRRQSHGDIRRDDDQAGRLHRNSDAEQTMSQLVLTPAGSVSVFGFKTPMPYPFGRRTHGLSGDRSRRRRRAAQADGADVLVSSVQRSDRPGRRDPVARRREHAALLAHDAALVPALKTIPENRVYVSPERANDFSQLSRRFRTGKVGRTMRTRRVSRSGASPIPYRRDPDPSVFGTVDGSRYRRPSSVIRTAAR